MASVYDDLPDEELGRRLKKKHPGKFDDVADHELGKAAKVHPVAQVKGSAPPTPPRPTAEQPTVPESDKTLKLQLQQLKSGIRRVVMFPRRTPVPYSARQFNAHRMDTSAGTFFFNPRLITSTDIRQAIVANDLPSILGDKDLGYGAPDKSELKQPVEAVTARAADGTPVQDVATDAEHEPKAEQAAEAVTPPGGSVDHQPVDEAIAERVQDGASDTAGAIPHTDIPEAMTDKPKKKIKFKKAQRLGISQR